MDKLIVLCTLVPLFILRRKKYHFTWLQMIAIFVAILMSGFLGSKVTGYNLRQYSAIIVDTVAMAILLIFIKKRQIFDYLSLIIALSCCTGKFPCLYYGCCAGRMVQLGNRIAFTFPSQIAEIAALAIVFVLLSRFEKSGKYTGRLWPIFMVMYGIERFLADLMRAGARQRLYLGMTEGEAGSLLVFMIGVAWLAILKRKEKTTR